MRQVATFNNHEWLQIGNSISNNELTSIYSVEWKINSKRINRFLLNVMLYEFKFLILIILASLLFFIYLDSLFYYEQILLIRQIRHLRRHILRLSLSLSEATLN